ncbi:ESX secretion-associated protein EspG [Amycolatopsis sp. OK19-0408]|uniref:ESX secretion-associated protein EspG n=1 Tax=Amycolatopsis iheyensis TaxID=2945988 RepID=A0A9X2NLD5_9PSEU|nr:ESX secretion-associated protein EspG [Amycolatopsis iheyensis]MCR6489528.1 ESX secretion-associated protein EspG [Amycolatopsis iheyensis]
MIFLPKAALLTAWEWERHGPPPAVLGADNLWLGDETRKRVEEKVLDVLASLRLATGGTLTREFREVLRVLAKGAHQFTAWLGDIEADESGAVLVSADGPDVVRLVRKNDQVRIDRVEPSRLAESLVDVLPPVPPARISPVSIPEGRFSGRAVEQSYDLADPTLDRGRDPLPWARRLMAARRTGLHQCYAVNRGSRSAPITAVDVAGEGRVLTYVYPGRERMVSFQPGTRGALVDVLYATLNGMGGR